MCTCGCAQKAARGSLHGGQYPYVEDPTSRKHRPIAETQQPSRGVGIGRAAKWDWSSMNESAAAAESSKTSSQSVGNACKLIVFVLGGVTFAETRSAYEVARETKTDVFIGGSCVLTPSCLIQLLKDQAAATAQF
eukprot:GHVS01052979.1.p1 GENE.GHVS01052979.1~~GHVS01052979.1.p1  ORF type:complete len:135 (+),score=19.56 GHVS01052979.1:80-484(+)